MLTATHQTSRPALAGFFVSSGQGLHRSIILTRHLARQAKLYLIDCQLVIKR